MSFPKILTLVILLAFCGNSEIVSNDIIVNTQINVAATPIIQNCAEYQGNACSKCNGGYNLKNGQCEVIIQCSR